MEKLFPREAFLDDNNKPLTQSLFLELGYSDYAIYTLKDIDWQLNGKNYPSLKRLYLEMEDPTEYDFATTYLLNFRHWQRICENKQIRIHIDEWRDELEYKLRSKAVKGIMESAKQGNFQAAKWFADRGWISRGAGRPSKEEVEREKKIQAGLDGEYKDDVIRLFQSK